MQLDLEELSVQPQARAKTIWLQMHQSDSSSRFVNLGRNQRFVKHMLEQCNLKPGADYLLLNGNQQIGVSLTLEHENLGSWMLLNWPRYSTASFE